MLSKRIIYACEAKQIALVISRSYQFSLQGVGGNRPSAYSLWEVIQAHCRRRHVDCRLIIDRYKDKKKGKIRTGYLVVEVFDPVASEIEAMVKVRSSCNG